MTDWLEPELNKKPGEEVTTSAPSGTIGGTGNKSPTPQTDSGSGNFVNLQGYLNANSGGAANNTAQGVVNNWGTSNGEAQKDVTAKAEDFKGKVQKNTFGYSDAERGQVQNVTFDDGQASNWAGWYSTPSYQGPTKADVPSAIQSGKVDELKSELGNSTPEGIKTSLTNTYGKNGNYGGGLSALDHLLVTNDSGASGVLSTGRKSTLDNLNGFLTGTSNDLTSLAGNAETSTNTNLSNLRSDVGGALTSNEGIITNDVNAMNSLNRGQMLSEIKEAGKARGVTIDRPEDYLTGNGVNWGVTDQSKAAGGRVNRLGKITGAGDKYTGGSNDMGYSMNMPALNDYITGNAPVTPIGDGGAPVTSTITTPMLPGALNVQIPTQDVSGIDTSNGPVTSTSPALATGYTSLGGYSPSIADIPASNGNGLDVLDPYNSPETLANLLGYLNT